jgi:hypothetical protein
MDKKVILSLCRFATPKLYKKEPSAISWGRFQPKLLLHARPSAQRSMGPTVKAPDFTEDELGTVWFKTRICVPEIEQLHQLILREAHDSAYSIHPGSTKMYQDLKEKYWWYGLKRDVATHVALCDVCQRVKAKHQRLAGLLQPLKVPEWK